MRVRHEELYWAVVGSKQTARSSDENMYVKKDDMNKQYLEYLKSDDWLTKKYIKRMKATRCGICNGTSNLHVHHLNYRNLVDVEMSDLRVLCKRCHFLAHDFHRAGKFKFKNTNHHSRFAILKAAVKRELGIKNINMFNDNR